MIGFRELRKSEFQRFIEYFCMAGTLKYRNNKWIGLNREGEPFTVHVKHGKTRKYSKRLVEVVAKDLGVSRKDFEIWYKEFK